MKDREVKAELMQQIKELTKQQEVKILPFTCIVMKYTLCCCCFLSYSMHKLCICVYKIQFMIRYQLFLPNEVVQRDLMNLGQCREVGEGCMSNLGSLRYEARTFLQSNENYLCYSKVHTVNHLLYDFHVITGISDSEGSPHAVDINC